MKKSVVVKMQQDFEASQCEEHYGDDESGAIKR